mgnify:CR=1 FL=1
MARYRPASKCSFRADADNDVARIAVPLLLYFALMWGGGFLLGHLVGLGYDVKTEQNASFPAFTGSLSLKYARAQR